MPLPIEDYAVIGDTETAALVGRNGSIDWLCVPRFDSGAIFAALLGTEEHGRWMIAPASPLRATRRRYRGDTMVLETEASGAFHDALMREVEVKLEMVVTEAELATLAKEKKRELRRQQRKAENERKRRLKQAASQAAAEAKAAANVGYEVPEEKRRRANRRRASRRSTKGTANERPREQVVDEADTVLRQSWRKAALEEARYEETDEGSSLGWQPTPARLQFVSRALRTALGMGGRRPLRQKSYYINRYISCSVTARAATLPSALFLLTGQCVAACLVCAARVRVADAVVPATCRAELGRGGEGGLCHGGHHVELAPGRAVRAPADTRAARRGDGG